MNIKREDWKYVNPDPDPDFDPEHNRRVIESTIKKNDALRKKKMKDYKDKVKERSDAVATYLKSLERGGKKGVDKYFGRRYLAYLRGKEVIEELKKKS